MEPWENAGDVSYDRAQVKEFVQYGHPPPELALLHESEDAFVRQMGDIAKKCLANKHSERPSAYDATLMLALCEPDE